MKNTTEYTKGLSIAIGALLGVIVGSKLGGLVTGLAVGAAVAIAIGAVLEHEQAPQRKKSSRKKRK